MVSLLSFFFFFSFLFYIIITLILLLYNFFNCTSLPFQAIQATFRAEEVVNYSHREMKEKEVRRIAAVDAFHMAEKSVQELKSKLVEEERERKSVAAALLWTTLKGK